MALIQRILILSHIKLVLNHKYQLPNVIIYGLTYINRDLLWQSTKLTLTEEQAGQYLNRGGVKEGDTG